MALGLLAPPALLSGCSLRFFHNLSLKKWPADQPSLLAIIPSVLSVSRERGVGKWLDYTRHMPSL